MASHDMDWSDESGNLVALQDKVYAYFDFVESGEVAEKGLLSTSGVSRVAPVEK